ncbi:unnamed protein product, partial [marine sediment metagenome]
DELHRPDPPHARYSLPYPVPPGIAGIVSASIQEWEARRGFPIR